MDAPSQKRAAGDLESSKQKKQKKEKKSKKEKGAKSGTPLICGSTHWAASIDVKEASKVLETPHTFAAMAGRQVSKVVMGPVALHGVLITKQGSAFTFGRNDCGQLGLGDDKTRSFPRKVDIDAKIVNAACGQRHTLFLTDSGEVYACGKNEAGQLGVGRPKLANSTTPLKLSTEEIGPIVQVACGAEFSMILNNRGELYAFGHPDKGCLGNGTNGEYFVSASKLSYHFEYAPIRVEGWWSKLDEADAVVEGRERTVNEPIHGVRIVEVSCGAQHTIALAEDGNVFTWGFGGYGRLGHAANADEHYPRLVIHFRPGNPLTGGAQRIWAGGFSNFVETRSMNQLWFWGQLKSSGEATMYPKPSEEIRSVKLKMMAVGNKHVVITTADGMTYTMGSSPCYGELGYGDGVMRSSTSFKEVEPIKGVPVIGISAGFAQTIFLADTSESSSKKTIYQLPSLGTPTDYHVVLDLAGEAKECLRDGNPSLLLNNIREMLAMIEATDPDTHRKLAKSRDLLTTVVTDVFEVLADSIASCGGKFSVAGAADAGPASPEAEDFVNSYIAACGADAHAIASRINSSITERIR
eukprot:m.434863 g.434863  ORF g.434863 m.434863 type:complete len:581 (-) comp17780_c0_seq1:1385-3127(-)